MITKCHPRLICHMPKCHNKIKKEVGQNNSGATNGLMKAPGGQEVLQLGNILGLMTRIPKTNYAYFVVVVVVFGKPMHPLRR